MRPQVAAVVAAAGVVARNQFTNITKKSRSFLRLFLFKQILSCKSLAQLPILVRYPPLKAGNGPANLTVGRLNNS